MSCRQLQRLTKGNQYNCSTWMDKMGSTTKAKNTGVPASIEIIDLLESALLWLDDCYRDGAYKHRVVRVALM